MNATLAGHLTDIRSQFPALQRQIAGQTAVYFDGPAGTQVPQRVAEAMTRALLYTNANRGGQFATAQESDALLADAQETFATFFGTADTGCIACGQNMTSLTFQLSHALRRTWQPGDEVMVSRLDHDANFTPWVRAAEQSGAVVRYIDIDEQVCTLSWDSFAAQLNEKTRLVAVGCASNAVGSINPFREMIRAAHQVGALVFLDAVHYAPHARLAVEEWDCDFVACSAYKFCGPHVGLLYGKREHLSGLSPDKLRPAPESLPGRWMTGTQSHEGIIATAEAIRYLAALSGRTGTLAEQLDEAYEQIVHYERELFTELLAGLTSRPELTVYGITDPERLHLRCPTVSFTHEKYTSKELARLLGERGIFVWHGNYYALPLTERLGLEPEGMVRVGLIHYNTAAEVERLLTALAELA